MTSASLYIYFLLWLLPPPIPTLTDTPFPCPSLFRSDDGHLHLDRVLAAGGPHGGAHGLEGLAWQRHAEGDRPYQAAIEADAAIGLHRPHGAQHPAEDRKSTRLNSSHSCASRIPAYA